MESGVERVRHQRRQIFLVERVLCNFGQYILMYPPNVGRIEIDTPLIDIVHRLVNILQGQDFRAIALTHGTTALGHDD